MCKSLKSNRFFTPHKRLSKDKMLQSLIFANFIMFFYSFQHFIRQIASIASVATKKTITLVTATTTSTTVTPLVITTTTTKAINDKLLKILNQIQQTRPKWVKLGHAPTETHWWLHIERIILLDHHNIKLIFNMFFNPFRRSHASGATNTEGSAFNRWVSQIELFIVVVVTVVTLCKSLYHLPSHTVTKSVTVIDWFTHLHFLPTYYLELIGINFTIKFFFSFEKLSFMLFVFITNF